jgi:hypothetical protein
LTTFWAENVSVTNGPDHEVQTFNGVTYTYVNDEHLSRVTFAGVSKVTWAAGSVL